ncbi:MAG: SpoIID/LytB domain-containing protein [Nitrospiraceae bacterium]
MRSLSARRLILSLVTAVLLSCVVTPTIDAAATATPATIRVMVAQEVARVEVQCEGALTVMTLEGQRVTLPAPAVLSVTARGVALNASTVVSERLTVVGATGRLTVLAIQGPGGSLKAMPGGGVTIVGGTSPVARWPLKGALQVYQRGRGLLVVNDLNVEDYVMGVVPAEVNAGWHPELLKAQAVAARTYALYQRTQNPGREFDVVASTQDQVYQGTRGVDEPVMRAVDGTRGLVLSHQGRPIYAAFSSTAAGPTEDAMNVWSKDLPYLRGVQCPFDTNSPYYRWRVSVPLEKVERSLRQLGVPVGTIASVTPFAFSRAGRVTRVRLLHSEGELVLRGEDLRKVVGYSALPSTRFEIESIANEVVFSGFGAGHGVGMCQWGAKQLAELGYPFHTILAYYYPGTELKSVADVDLSPVPPVAPPAAPSGALPLQPAPTPAR